ncbi:erythromycin esterase family protein [Saccharothrix obliqua]|uniref:erythromycin esterase family protein n=1 Tax=Saccharothrix obliqua TaxID=2861747 RepID=UPI001C5D1248|nr:erythromycin esterase family protein [Saccharothrix obliqua]MBW4721571.1 erythromycin esterase family protein [Saccharothrix obliqua]
MTTEVRLSDEAVIPLRTLDPAAALDDLAWLDEVVGRARVVAIGESAHYNAESYLLRHRLLRYLVERHGFGAYAMETGFTEAHLVDQWLHGGSQELGHVMANGITSLMGLWSQMGDHLKWMRRHGVGFHGIDLGGSNASLLPGLDAVLAYLAEADPGFEADLRDTASAFAPRSAFSLPAAFATYAALPTGARDALTAGLADLTARVTARRLEYVRRTSVDAYDRALHSLRLTTALDGVVRAMARGDQQGAHSAREAAIADTVEWVLRREDRIVLAAHNGHVQRWPGVVPAVMGLHLADRLGPDYVVIGTTTGTGRTLNTAAEFFAGELFTDLAPPRPGTLDALAAAAHDGPFAVNLRHLPPADTAVLDGVVEQRSGTFHGDVNLVHAYDVIVHLPHVTAATPDEGALAASPEEVRVAFSRWGGR